MKVKVVAPYSVNVDGKNYSDGQTVDVPDVDAERWIAAGWTVAEKAATPQKAKAVKASKNKAVTSSPNKGFVGTLPKAETVTFPTSKR